MKKRRINIVFLLLMTVLGTILIETLALSVVIKNVKQEKLCDGTELTVFAIEW